MSVVINNVIIIIYYSIYRLSVSTVEGLGQLSYNLF